MTAPVLDIAAVIKEAAEAAIPAPQPEEKADAPASDEGAPDAPEDAEDTDESVADDAAEASDASDSEGDGEGDEAPDLPDGYVAVPTVSEGLATEFVLKDAHGEVEVPELIVEYKANGKVRQDRLDQVVKLAQWGVYNQEREQKVAEAEQAFKEREALAQMMAEREAQMERLLTDDDFLYAVRQAYENENSPERRAERAEQEKEQLRTNYAIQQISQTGEQFYTTEVVPALNLIAQALPSFTPEELGSKLQVALQAHVEVAPNGVAYIPPSRYDAIRQYILDDLAVWAQAAHTRRQQPATAAEKQAKAELQRAQVSAQKAKRQIGQTMKPVGRAAPDKGPTRASKPATVDDAVSSALESVLSSIAS